jgi:hypothetical protein
MQRKEDADQGIGQGIRDHPEVAVWRQARAARQERGIGPQGRLHAAVDGLFERIPPSGQQQRVADLRQAAPVFFGCDPQADAVVAGLDHA